MIRKLLILVVVFVFCGTALAQTNPHLRHGEVQMLNDTGFLDLSLGASGKGNGISLYCPATEEWSLFLIPPTVMITSLTDNGAGKIRVTHASNRTFKAGQWLTSRGSTGVISLNLVPGGFGSFRVAAVISATQFDTDISWPGGSYTGNGQIDPIISANIDHITINGTADQAMPTTLVNGNPIPHLVGLRYLDTGCTVGELVLDTTLENPANRDFVNLNKDSETGLNLLPSYDKVPLVGMTARHPVAGTGNNYSILNTSYYTRGPRFVQAWFAGSTGGATNTYVEIPVASGLDEHKMRALGFRGQRWRVDGVLHLNTTVNGALIFVRITATYPDQTTWVSEFAVSHPGGAFPMPVSTWISGSAFTGFIKIKVEMKTSAGTATIVNSGVNSQLMLAGGHY